VMGARVGRESPHHSDSILHICVARAEHGRKAGGFFFAPAFFARLFKVPVITDDLQRPFAVNFLL